MTEVGIELSQTKVWTAKKGIHRDLCIEIEFFIHVKELTFYSLRMQFNANHNMAFKSPILCTKMLKTTC